MKGYNNYKSQPFANTISIQAQYLPPLNNPHWIDSFNNNAGNEKLSHGGGVTLNRQSHSEQKLISQQQAAALSNSPYKSIYQAKKALKQAQYESIRLQNRIVVIKTEGDKLDKANIQQQDRSLHKFLGRKKLQEHIEKINHEQSSILVEHQPNNPYFSSQPKKNIGHTYGLVLGVGDSFEGRKKVSPSQRDFVKLTKPKAEFLEQAADLKIQLINNVIRKREEMEYDLNKLRRKVENIREDKFRSLEQTQIYRIQKAQKTRMDVQRELEEIEKERLKELEKINKLYTLAQRANKEKTKKVYEHRTLQETQLNSQTMDVLEFEKNYLNFLKQDNKYNSRCNTAAGDSEKRQNRSQTINNPHQSNQILQDTGIYQGTLGDDDHHQRQTVEQIIENNVSRQLQFRDAGAQSDTSLIQKNHIYDKDDSFGQIEDQQIQSQKYSVDQDHLDQEQQNNKKKVVNKFRNQEDFGAGNVKLKGNKERAESMDNGARNNVGNLEQKIQKYS